jgi:hypothetical protein
MATKVAPKPKKTDVAEYDHNEAALVQGGGAGALAGQMSFGGVEGELDRSDFQMPKLELVHGVGDLSALFDAGDIVYNSCVKLASKNEPVFLAVLAVRKFYRESLPYDPDRDTPSRVFLTAEEASDAGLTTQWDNETGAPPQVDKVAEIRVAIECPDGVDPDTFPLVCDAGESGIYRFAVATWYVSRTAYAPVAKPIFNAAAMLLRDNVHAGRWRLATNRVKKSGNVVTMPVFRFDKRYPEAVVKFFETNVRW